MANPHSCLDIMRQGVTRNGVCHLSDETGAHFPAYCDLTSEPSLAWTLIESFSLAANRVKQLPRLTLNSPINENSPNWVNYRMTLGKMKTLREYLTHWRATCSFPSTITDQGTYRVDLSLNIEK